MPPTDPLTPFLEAVKQSRDVIVDELWETPLAYLVTQSVKESGKNVLLITAAGEESALHLDIAEFSETPLYDFPAWEALPSENVAPSVDIVGDRYQILSTIHKGEKPFILITNLQGCLQKLIDPTEFNDATMTLTVGSEIPFDELLQHLQKIGYERRAVASDKGEFSVRGGLIDLFPVASPDPFRLEFFGDQIESIRIYDPIGQKSVRKVDELTITPAKELELLASQPQLATLLDYLGKDTLVILDDLLAIEDRYANLVKLASKPSPYFSSLAALFEELKKHQKIYFARESLDKLTPVKRGSTSEIEFEFFEQKLKAYYFPSPFLSIHDYLMGVTQESLLEALKRGEEHWEILCTTEREKKQIEELLLTHQITKPKIHVQDGYLSSGFAIPARETVYFPMTELTHRTKLRRGKHRSSYHTPVTESFDLQAGDAVVHLQHGIGRFLGVDRRPDHTGTLTEFFLLEYAEGSRLFVPIKEAHLITKYIGTSEEAPTLHAIGGTRWKRAKEKTMSAIVGYAKELLDLYARRSVTEGFSYAPDSEEMRAFEEQFPYVETVDQQEAINQLKMDMCSKKMMDRLVCGDVGYGKTEVAMRAAFKAVVDGGKQVALLVPTTVLAMQHFDNFCERMRDFPVRIEVLSRFQKPKKIQQVLELLQKGAVDILIGTHRIISEDVIFKNLGLCIIDEEQRFGVKAKEHLKKLKVGVDCLTLTATPIPRTLYLSLMGARDLSQINTPPEDRIPTKTVISEMSDELLKSALLRELARSGQSFVIHNRVESIFELASRIKQLLPQAKVIVAHGQMHPDEIDTLFHTFKKGEADILVATTIVENGVDIPNANTILIDRADRFGMAELYQLRGRVGRWNRQAFAYFLVPNLKLLPEISRKRLHALATTSGFGGGMKVALRDLEIRGAGNILGQEQSGQVETIGFHQYCKWLKRAVKSLKGELSPLLTETKVEAKIDARLPEDYVNEVSLRMEFYQRLGEAITFEEVDEIGKELEDRFGPLPPLAENLLSLSRVRAFAASHGITLVEVGTHTLAITGLRGKQQALFKVPTEPKAWAQALLDAIKKY